MDSTAQALGGLLLKAVPTIVLLVIVHVYLKAMFFGPLQKVLAERRAATEGAREAAEAALKKAADKANEVQDALRQAQEEIYREQEEARKNWLAVQNEKINEARRQGHELVQKAKQELDLEAAAARRELSATTDALAEQIVQSLLERKAS